MMCRSQAEGGRRCPCTYYDSRAHMAARQRSSRARRGLEAAEARGDTAGAAVYRGRLDEATSALKQMREANLTANVDAPLPPRAPGTTATGQTETAPNTAGDVTTPGTAAVATSNTGTPTGTPESLVRAAYQELAVKPQDWVRLSKLRDKLNGVDRDEVDRALLEMTKTGFVHLAPDSNRKALTDADHASAIQLGDQDNHLLAIEEPPPVSGEQSAAPLLENGWDTADWGARICYHEDGPIGSAVLSMGAAARMDVDGEPLGNVLGKLATDVVRGHRSPQQALDELKVLRDRLPETGRARSQVDYAVYQMDGPDTPPPTVPDGAPEPLRRLANELHAIPMVRKDPTKELAPVLALAEDFVAGKVGRGGLMLGVRQLAEYRHESLGECGKFTIERAITTAVDELKALPSEAFTPPQPQKRQVAAKPTHEPAGSGAVDSAAWQGRVSQAFTELAGRPGGWVSLARLRAHLGNPDKAEFDEVLRELSLRSNVYLIPEANSKVLTPEDRAAAVHLGGEDKHLISFE